MSGLVHELQTAALDESGVPILSLLRKAKVVSAKLNVTTIETWLEHELNGYPTPRSTPVYRHVFGRAICFNPYRGWIPLEISNPEAQRMICLRKISMPISQLCKYAEDKQEEGTLILTFTPEISAKIQAGMREPFEPALEISVNLIQGIMSTIRNKVLEFSLDLERQGVLGEGMSFTQQEKLAASNITYSINIENMTGSQLQQGTSHSTQAYTQTTDLGGISDFIERLLPVLGQLQSSTDSDQIQSDLETIRSQLKAPTPKTGIIRESLHSVRTVLEGTAGNVAAEFLPLIPALLASLRP